MFAFLWWTDTLFLSTSTSSGGFNSLNTAMRWADWVLNDDWTVFFTFTSVNFATFVRIDEFTIIEFFFFGTDWNWNVFVWEHGSAFVWVLFIGTFTNWFTAPRDTAISPVINVVVFVSITDWSRWAEGSVVYTNSLFTVVEVEVISGDSVVLVVNSIGFINIGLSVAPFVTVASLTVIISISETVVGGEGISLTVGFDFTDILFFFITATFFWLFATAGINGISVSSKSAFDSFFTVQPVVPVVIVILESFTFLSFVKFIFGVISAFITNTFVRNTTVIKNFFDLLFVTIFTVWIKFTGNVSIPVFPVAWYFIVTSLFDASVFWTANVSRSSSSPRVVAVVTPRLSWSEVFVFGAFWMVWARISFIITDPGVAFMTSTRFTVSFLVNITKIEGESVFPPSVSDLSGTFVNWWDAF
jgi:hypothetical protein